ncbi:MAG: SusC/RagA family TonB-linked outer membrane protein [Odoribacter sp.]
MRLCLYLLLVFNFQLAAVGVAQQKQVTLNMQNVSARELFREIQRQTGYFFVFNTAQVRELGQFTVDARGKQVDVLLQELLEGRGYTFSFEDEIIVLTPREVQQQTAGGLQLSGRVTDPDGQPLPGVTIRAKHTGVNSVLGTVTDADGKYKITLPSSFREGMSLIFTFVGMETVEVKYAGKKVIDVTMTDDKQELEEVVVTGYQVIDKRSLTSSIETIKAGDLDKVGALTVDQMLEGKAAGLMVTNVSSTPGAAAKVRVRSGGTFTGSRAPLWVVDGIIYEDPVPLSADDINSFDRVNLIGNALTGINPQDIETINILKDASATAIYGTRAANGVIVVTTKRGKKGKASVRYSGSMSVVDRPRYSDFNLMNSRERVDVSREIAQKNLGYPEDIFTWVGYEKVLRDYRFGAIDFGEFQRQVGEVETMNTDWFKELYRPAITTSHSVNLSGGTDNMRYYFSLGYNNDNGTERGVDLNRVTARSNIDIDLRKNLSVSLGMSGSVQEAGYNHSSINLFDEAYYNSRTVPFRNADGSLFFMEEKLREQNNQINTVKYNVMQEMNNSQKNVDNKDFNINAQMNWTLVKGVKLMASASYRNTTNLQEEWITDKTRFVARLRTYDEVEDMVADWEKRYSTVPFGGLYSGSMVSQRTLRGQVQLNLSKVIANKHVFNLNLGYEANTNKYKGSSGWTSPGYNHDQGRGFIRLPDASMAASTGDLNEYGYINMIKWLTKQGDYDIYPAVTDRLSNSLSMFGIFNYSYDNRYILNFNMRSDGSNSFGQYERYKFKPTWSVSGRWNIHNEKFWNAEGQVEELAARLSYGFRGNPPSGTPYMLIHDYIYDSNFGENTALMSGFPNAGVTWEKTSTLNVGLNYSLFGGRLSGAFDFAYSHGTDLLLSRPVSLANGQATQQYNGGEKKDYSYELSLSGTIIKAKDWGWKASVNATMTKEKVLAGYEAENTTLNVSNYLNGSIYLTGFPVDAFYSYQFDGLNQQGLPMFKNLENTSSDYFGLLNDILAYSGRRSPKVYGGFSTEVRYKRLTLRTSFSYKAGHHTRLLALYNGQQNMPMPHENMSGEFNNRWRQVGDEQWSVIPGLSNEEMRINTTGSGYFKVQSDKLVPSGATGYTLYDNSDIRVARAGHIRWQTLSLNYSLPERYLKKIGMNSLLISGQVSNLAVWAFDKKIDGQDPEQVRGIGMPALPSYSVSLSFGF